MAKGDKIADEASGAPDPLLVLVGSRIRLIRKRAKLKQSEVAAAIETKQAYMVGVEAGQQNITLKTLARIATALGVAPMTLLLEGELALAADEGKLDQLGELLRRAMQDTDRVAEVLREAYALVSARQSSPTPAASAQAGDDQAQAAGDSF